MSILAVSMLKRGNSTGFEIRNLGNAISFALPQDFDNGCHLSTFDEEKMTFPLAFPIGPGLVTSSCFSPICNVFEKLFKY